ncbi:MAG: AI-2E family transporter [Methanomicrobiales archaeon]|nr:AI-2E family transporter [Methanomicrobiales archaeon]MDI6875980.1 AI-2E family transporter [Methanomicrobiales archaeon]
MHSGERIGHGGAGTIEGTVLPSPGTGGEGIGARFPPIARTLLIGAAAVVVLAGMRGAASIVSPLLFSAFLAVIGSAALQWLERRGLPRWLAFVVLIAGLIVLGILLVAFLALSFNQLLDRLPFYRDRFLELEALIRSSLGGAGIDSSAIIPSNAAIQDAVVGLLSSLISLFQTVASEIFIILLATAFLLAEVPRFRDLMQGEAGRGNRMVAHLLRSGDGIVRFLIIRIQINFIVGIGFGLFLYLLGVDFALLWGFLAFVLGFIPYIGFLLTAVPPFLLALLEQGPVGGLIVIAGLVLINLVGENVIFPEMAGRGLNLSPFVVIASIFFWGFVLGWLGVFLAVPLTYVLKILLESSEDTRWLADLMGSGNAAEPGEG